MFNGMMDPEMIRLAQEQMSRMSPADFARIQQQMMSNPDLMKMATEGMKNMRPEDLKMAAEQLKHTRPEEMAEIGEKMANASPEEIAAMRARADVQMTYELSAAEVLKKKGNELHSQGRFSDASEKYLLAKKNLQGILSSKGRTVLLACSLNLMSCYLKTRQYDECINEGSEVLAYDANNIKALYRRGQAYKELGQLEDAVSDLSKALEVSPDDETIADVLRDAKEKLAKEGGGHARRGLVIEEITEGVETVSSKNHKSSSMEHSVAQPHQNVDSTKSQSAVNRGGIMSNSESLHALKDDPDTIRSFQNFISTVDPDTLAAMSSGKSGEGENPYFMGGSSDNNPGSSVPPNMTPDMLKTATNMMNKMSPEDLQKMFETASSLKGMDSFPTAAAVKGLSDAGPKSSAAQENPVVNRSSVVGESSSSRDIFSNLRTSTPSSFPSSTPDLQEQMRNQMKDPAMRQMFTSMIKNMNPDMMANMSEQFGMKLSREDAAKAQQAMSSLSPDDLDKMMRWADRLQRGVEGVKKTKNWLLGRPGLILAICMLILAMILHRLGYIGG
ncbi:hypothetical protein CMV_030364 [Castanea mollissima]|uniref:Outer envelope protein 61 n=1 Tax=Castanea mollissima TaxID=60419 RepID=A0A8J4Q4E6_9ROSI|nr:hypothetical protein CMV_030364 [Castanea mollissima]